MPVTNHANDSHGISHPFIGKLILLPTGCLKSLIPSIFNETMEVKREVTIVES